LLFDKVSLYIRTPKILNGYIIDASSIILEKWTNKYHKTQ
jgi:hypothetical protein